VLEGQAACVRLAPGPRAGDDTGVQAASAAPATETRVSSLEGARQLGAGIEAALQTFGQALLDEPKNQALRAALAPPGSAESYLAELLGLVFRCVFLLTLEARGCLHPPGSAAQARER
jgi:hypothetical protein